MATIDVTTSRNLTAVTYATGDTINVLDGVTLTINSQWSVKPFLIQALGTGRIEVSNSSTTTPHVQEFSMSGGVSAGGFTTQQNGVLQVRGGWITVGTSTGTSNQVLFSSNSVGGASIDYPTMIQVETGNGTNVWEIWNAIPEDVTNGTNNTVGFNGVNDTTGTVAVSAVGVVTGISTNFQYAQTGLNFKLPGIARDFVISSWTSTTQITIQELDGSTYAGGIVAAGASYIVRTNSLINASQVGNGDLGKVLFFNPVTSAVRMGDDTNGTKIPTGARVRIPNIHFNSALQQTTLAAAITSTAAQNITLASAIGITSNNGYATTSHIGTLLLVNGSTFERIYYLTRSGTTVSSASMVRGANGTVAQASFPIGTTVYWIPSNNYTTNNAAFNCNPSGTMDLQICSTGLRMQNAFTNYSSITLKNFGSCLLNVNSSAGTYSIDSVSVMGSGYQAPYSIITTANFSAMIGAGSIANVHTHNTMAAQASALNIQLFNIQNASSLSNFRSRIWNRSSSASSLNFRGILIQTVKSATPVDGIYVAGAGLITSALTNIDVKNIFISSLPNSNSASSGDLTIPFFLNGTVNSTFRGIQIWGGGLATRQNLMTIASDCDSIVVHNKGYTSFNGGLQCTSIINDAGLNTVTAWFSLTNPRTSSASSYLTGNITTNSGGLLRMLLIDSITTTTTGTGGSAKGGAELDMIAGPHRQWASATTASIVPNLVDVQPIVVLSNLAKTVGSIYVGAFSAQTAFDMYTFGGGTYLDNLGRIYYPNIGDSVIIKSVFALKGFSAFTGTAFDFNYNLGSGTNPIPAGTTVEFRMTNWGTANTGSWTTLTSNANLETARAALSGFSSTVGIDLQFRITGTTAVAGRYLMSLKLPVTIDSAYNPPVYSTYLGFTGAQVGTLIAGYLNTTPSNPVRQASLTLTSSSGSVPMPYDYDAVPVSYRLVARKAGWTFSSLTGTYTKAAISIPITQTQVVDTSGTALYSSGVTGVTVDHVSQRITVSASRTAAQIWSVVQDSLCLLENLTIADPFSTNNGSAFYSTYNITVTGSITAGNIITTGVITLSGGTIPNGYTDANGTVTTLTITGVKTGSDVVIRTTTTPDGSGSNVLQTFDAISGTTAAYTYTYASGTQVNIDVYLAGYKDYHIFGVPLGSTASSLPVSQLVDRNYL